MAAVHHIARRGQMQYPTIAQAMVQAHYRVNLNSAGGVHRVRARSDDRVELVIANTSGGIIELGSRTQNNPDYNAPAAWPYSVPAGSEAVITSDSLQWYVRRVDGAADVFVDVYIKEVA